MSSFQPLLVSFLALSSVVVAAPLRTTPKHQNPVGQLVELGHASVYTIITQTGLASSTSNIIGNIGISPAAMTYHTGLDLIQATADSHATSLQVIKGTIWAPETALSTSPIAGSEANAAYTALKNQAADTTVADFYPAALDGQKFTPGVYAWTTPIVLGVGAKVYLSGKCGDVFIFKTTGEISSGANSAVVLSGGLTANSVYWVGSTSLTTGANSVWRGINLLFTNVVIGTGGRLIGAIFSQTEVALQSASVKPAMAGRGDPVALAQTPFMCSTDDGVVGKLPGLTPPANSGLGIPVSPTTVQDDASLQPLGNQ